MPANRSRGLLVLGVLAILLVGAVVLARYIRKSGAPQSTGDSSLPALDPALGLGDHASSAGSRRAHAHDVPPGAQQLRASLITVIHDSVAVHAGPRPRPKRSMEEARALATRIAAEAKADPTRFPSLAREQSDDRYSLDGGEVPTWQQGGAPSLDNVLLALAVGAVSDPIDTEAGFVILRRETPLEETTVSARRLLVAWTGASRAPASVSRSKAAALERANQLADRARKDPGAFTGLVAAESDGWDAKQGGQMGRWETGGGRYPLSIDKALLAVHVGEIAGPVESLFGYEVLLRVDPGPKKQLFSGSHILLSYRSAAKPVRGVTRSREEALNEAQKVLAELRDNPDRFAKLARERSDDATAKTGGDLGSWAPGKMPPAIQSAIEGLEFGQVGGPVETDFGFHVLLRKRAPTDMEFLEQ